jgi:hypothetical protein
MGIMFEEEGGGGGDVLCIFFCNADSLGIFHSQRRWQVSGKVFYL